MSTTQTQASECGRIIKHYRDERWAVEFFGKDDRRYRTLFTTRRTEADGWHAVIEQTGWCVSASPSRARCRWENEDYVRAYTEAA